MIVGAIPKKYIIPTGSNTITSNGTVNIAAYEFADINVQPQLQTKSVIPLSSTQTITADYGYYGLSSVNIEMIPSEYVIPSGNLGINSNGNIDISKYKTATVDVKPNLQDKTVTPSEYKQTIQYDNHYDGLS